MKIAPGSTIGILGGGQLGKMMVLAASKLGYKTVVYSNAEDSPAFDVANEKILDSYENVTSLERFASLCDVITVEFENIPYQTALALEKRVTFRPNPRSLFISQNRIREKSFVQTLGIDTTPFIEVTDLTDAIEAIGTPCILKTAEFGYDGKGQIKIDQETDLPSLSNSGGILEKLIPFQMEISVVAARGLNGEFVPYTPVQNVHRDGILDTTIAPAEISEELGRKAVEVTKTLMEALEYIGILAVEFFVTQEDELLVNEFAPRPHNSGHWTIDACCTCQFEQHIRAICGLSLGNPDYHCTAVMRNLIGKSIHDWPQILMDKNDKLHIYGKKSIKPGRKMGHVTRLNKNAT